MARNLNMAVFAAIVAALVISSVSAASYEVGDGLGWNIPPGGAVAYTTWASNHTFHAGDILVFKFASGQDDVAKVTKAAYDDCNATNPISLTTSSPANLTLTSGEHYYICTFGGHCNAGQKLTVNVTGSTSSPPASAPSSPPSASSAPVLAPEPSSSTSPPAPAAPAPSPSSGPTTYTVGGNAGWNVLLNDSYAKWASDKTFHVGDILVFYFVNGTQNVAEVTKTNYESCNNNTIALFSNPPVRITLNTTGVNYFICTFPKHCSNGQKLAINVTGTAPAPSPSTTATPPTTSAPVPSPSTTATPPTTSAPVPSPSTTATPPTTSATPPPTTTPSTPTPSSPNAATSVGVAGLSATLLSAAVALFMF